MTRFVTIVLLYILAANVLFAQESDGAAFITINGTVRDSSSKKGLENVSITVPGSNIGTVSNADGTFSLKIPAEYSGGKIKAEQLGYFSNTLSIADMRRADGPATIMLSSSAKMLREVVVRGGKPEEIVGEALKKIPDNYPSDKNLFTAFYRETVQKGKRYIGVSEAVIDVFKTPYKQRINVGERVQVKKGAD